MKGENMVVEFSLSDGRTARVEWVNGPPYLSVSYHGGKSKEQTAEDRRKAVGEAARKGFRGNDPTGPEIGGEG